MARTTRNKKALSSPPGMYYAEHLQRCFALALPGGHMLADITSFLRTGIWRIRVRDLPRAQSLLLTNLRVIVLAVRGFDEDRCALKASALTFYTLLSIVPVLAMLFGIAKGFGFESLLERELLENLQGQEKIVQTVIGFSRSLLENTRGGVVAGAGVVLLFWTVIKLLGNIEHSFNDIWGVPRGRSLGRRFSDYLSAMLVCPVLFILAGSTTVAVSAHIRGLAQHLPFLQAISPLILESLRLTPYLFTWGLFSFVYIFLPNTQVTLRSGLLGGIVAGTGYQLLQWGYISFQIGVLRHNAIYGGFAALPLFLIWLQTSWLIVLIGAEISFAHQHVHTYEFEPDCLSASRTCTTLLALQIVHAAVVRFQEGGQPLTADEIVAAMQIPIRLANPILAELVACGILSEITKSGHGASAYQPARSINDLTISAVLEARDDHGSSNLPIAPSPALGALETRIAALRIQVRNSEENLLLKDLDLH